ncbi:SPFH domain-containing protein [Dichotomicrobium thermohalophilum]|uniref:SPFH domain-containing protein n=1 Tax=Dichotomicrobium thermohalophilum TaxID=933063 RepID=A0A397Q9U8_9HYPH|nr:SPFH domain-containing protein [Dichotomicrobium thermohalophilum]
MGPFEIFAIAVAIVLVITVAASVVIVPQGSNFTVERLGRYVRTLKPGLRVVVPFVEKIGHRVVMMEQVLDIPTQDVITRDNVEVQVDAVAFMQVLDAAQSAYAVADLRQAMITLVLTNTRTVMGSMELDELLSNRDAINSRLLRIMDEATHPWGVKISRIEIKDINPPADITEAMARQMKAERDKRAEILEAEGDKSARVLQAEGLKQSLILEAEGRKEAAFRDAEAREREAEADARATEMVSRAIAEGNVQSINYFVANRYVEALKNLASAENSKVLMMPVEAASVIGAIGGITELTREAFGSPGGQPPPAAPDGADRGTQHSALTTDGQNGKGNGQPSPAQSELAQWDGQADQANGPAPASESHAAPIEQHEAQQRETATASEMSNRAQSNGRADDGSGSGTS